MKAFLLVLAIAGQPEQNGAICDSYQECSDAGATMQKMYVAKFHKPPSAFSYRVIPVLLVPLDQQKSDGST